MNMTCIEYRQRVGAEPSVNDPAIRRHQLECRACSEFAASQRQLDRQLEAALRIPAPEGLRARIIWRAASDKPVWRRWIGMAATVVLSVGVGFTVWMAGEHEALAGEIVAHLQHEPELLLQTDSQAEPRKVSAVMSRGGLGLDAPLQDVTHAGLCPFRGRLVPHLVIRVDGEPVSVMLLPGEPVDNAQEIHESGFNGIIVPSKRGSMAIVAAREDLVQPVRTQLEQAVNWGI